jgi:hypothetical protein
LHNATDEDPADKAPEFFDGDVLLEESVEHMALPKDGPSELESDTIGSNTLSTDTELDQLAIPPLPRQPSTATATEPEDLSEPVVYPKPLGKIDTFIFALGVWCERCSISQSQYISLLEVLLLTKNVNIFKILPQSLSMLKHQSVSHLPLLSQQYHVGKSPQSHTFYTEFRQSAKEAHIH